MGNLSKVTPVIVYLTNTPRVKASRKALVMGAVLENSEQTEYFVRFFEGDEDWFKAKNVKKCEDNCDDCQVRFRCWTERRQ